ncbi:ribosome biogenesis GTPase YlqF [bacterium]|nr:ribosome biogenesis GTPase YlqF [bacterium]
MTTDIQWFPGHMAKTRRELESTIPQVDVVVELRDARAPNASTNPIIHELCRNKARVIVLNKADIADSHRTTEWVRELQSEGVVIPFSATQNQRKGLLAAACRDAMLRRHPNRAITSVTALVAGIPNVGKSAIINQLRGKTVVKAANKPGVTRGLTWIKVDDKFRVADTPGVLWPKFDPPEVGILLAAIGAIKDERLDAEFLALWIIRFLTQKYPKALATRYKIDAPDSAEGTLELIAKKRGIIGAGGGADIERMASILVSEFRTGKLGRVSLE